MVQTNRPVNWSLVWERKDAPLDSDIRILSETIVRTMGNIIWGVRAGEFW